MSKTKRIELKLDLHTYRASGGYAVLCAPTLRKYFDLEDRPHYITVVISDTPTKEAYFVQQLNGSASITLSSWVINWETIYATASRLLRQYPKGCYVSIEA